MKNILIVLTALFLTAGVFFSFAQEPKAEGRVPDPGFVDLFNGVDLSGWVDVNTSGRRAALTISS